MAWFDRLKEAAYTSPGGIRAAFNYENVSSTFNKKTSAYDFPDAEGTFVQDRGSTGRRYPMRVIFWGPDCDIAAADFENLLREPGVGKLEHPLYGTFNVVPFGTVTRRDDLKEAANQAIIELTFWETTGIVYPSGQTDPGGAVVTSVDEFNEAVAAEFSENVDLGTAVETATFKNTYDSILTSVSDALDSIAEAQDDVAKQFNAINDSITAGLDTLVQDPLTLAFQTSLLLQAPGRALSSIQDRLDAYGGLVDLITGGDSSTPNKVRLNDLVAESAVTGSIISVVNTAFSRKTEAIVAAEAILDQMAAVVAWRDAAFEDLGEVDTGGAYQKLLDAVATAAGFLVEISFTLKQERRLVLTRARTVIDLLAELYGEIDSQIDFFIQSNDLSGDEILEIPAGREIVFYI